MKRVKSRYPGVRYREHPTRKHGVGQDRYFSIFYKLDGKMVEEACGWASMGMTEKKAAAILAELQENQRRGEGPRTLREKRGIEEQARQAQAAIKKQEADDAITFGVLFSEKYMPASKASKRNTGSWRREESLFRLWIKPVIDNKPLKKIAPIHLEKIKSDMTKAGLAPRSVNYAIAVIRQTFNFARLHGFYSGDNPVYQIKKPSIAGNQRLRFLTHQEASDLLKDLANRSIDTHDQALLSLHTGMRAGEIFNLTWSDVDLDRDLLTLRDTKSGRNRTVFMTKSVHMMFESRERGAPSDLVFPARILKKSEAHQKKQTQVSDSFNRAVNAVGLNDGINDRRQKVCFHSLRHTHASWLVENGVDLYVIKELLGHQDFRMTTRYSHLGKNALQAAVQSLDGTLEDFISAPRKKLIKRKKAKEKK